MTALDRNALDQHDRKASLTLMCRAEDLRALNLSSANDALPPAEAAPAADAGEIARLYAALDLVSIDRNPRTAQLLDCGKRKMGQKLIEEASEVAFEGLRNRARGVVRESADLIYHLVVLWRECGVAPDEVWEEMRQRAETLGIAEKLPKRPKD
ncbi:phosphoribosyl-ATP pyrophosphatase [Rhizobiales bacterium GAS113]|jgi:phosphoribosyl-ATP pyrophosphohydrolase|nr:phosphoribosyl-ATP pyrophosphatase [Rhizobiales bacterium GAS113]SEC61067.1 phosphoribosyl-ATP pyrophosphatase [Rhizobiales bacterium GAS188]